MAVLDSTNRLLVGNHVMRVLSVAGLVKADLRAAVEATDQWIEDNQASYNTALPNPARTTLNTVQKTIIFCYVAMRRANLLRVQED